MIPPAPEADVLRPLGRLVRGLSVLFWGLPLALVVCVQTARMSFLSPLGVVPPVAANCFLFYGLHLLGQFQKDERAWQRGLDRARLLCLVNIGLSPFLYWFKILPQVLHYQMAVLMLGLTGVLFLFDLNYVLRRLAAMLPDETVQMETKMFTTLNLYLLTAVLVLAAGWQVVSVWRPLPAWWIPFFQRAIEAYVVWLVFLILLPLALTMALFWKIKEVVLGSVFGRPAGRDALPPVPN
jgi:hypothetical protein